MTTKRYRWLLGAILVFAFAIRLAGAVWWQGLAVSEGRDFRMGDSDGYWVLAEAIVQGKPYQYGSENGSIFRAPGYPILLSSVAWISPKTTAIMCARILGAVLGTAAVLLVALLGSRFFGRPAGLASALLAALYAGAIGMSVIVLSEALFCPLMIGMFLVLPNLIANDPGLDEKKVLLYTLLAGVIAGMCVLTRPSWLLFPPFATFLTLLVAQNRIKCFGRVVALAAGMVLVMSPWWYRNWTVTGEFVPTNLQVGASLYDGLHEGATGGSDEGMEFASRALAEQNREDSEAGSSPRSTLEYRLNQRLARSAIAWVSENPSAAIRLAFVKFGRTWALWPRASEVGSVWVKAAESVGCFGILLLSVVGIAANRSKWLQYWWVVLPVPYFTLLHMVFVGSVRYRQPAVLVLCVVAGAGLVALFKSVKQRLR